MSDENFETLRSRRSEVENKIFYCLCENMKPYDNPSTIIYNIEAERLAMAVGRAYVDWCVEQRGVIRNKQSNEVSQTSATESSE